MTRTQQANLDVSADLNLKQLIALAQSVKDTHTLTPEQQKRLLQRISKRIWQRSVAEYDGY